LASHRLATQIATPRLDLPCLQLPYEAWPGLALPRLAISRPRLPPPYLGLASATTLLRIGLGLGHDIASHQARIGIASVPPRPSLVLASVSPMICYGLDSSSPQSPLALA
jgi:hypothetical protein